MSSLDDEWLKVKKIETFSLLSNQPRHLRSMQTPTQLLSEIKGALDSQDYDTAKAKCDAVSGRIRRD